MRIFLGLALGSLCLVIFAQPSSANECLRFGAPEDTTGRYVGQLFNMVMAYHGICTSIEHLPNKRSTEMLLNGEIDGEILRIEQYRPAEEGGFIRVPTAIGSTQRLLISRHDDIRVLADLEDRSLGIWLGAVWQSEFSENVTNRVELPSFDVMVAMLLNDRLDAILMDDVTLTLYRDQIPPEFVRELGTERFYAWISREKSHQMSLLDQSIAAFHRNGLQFYLNAFQQ